MHDERLTLATLCGGAVQEKVDRALERVARNILDPNTDPAKKRSITLKITLKPDEDDNEDVEVSADVSVSLAPELGVNTRFFVNKNLENDKVTVMEHRKGEIRGQLDFSDFEKETVVSKAPSKTVPELVPDDEYVETETIDSNVVLDLRKKTM